MDDIDCIRKGKYLVIKDTHVAVHETEERIIGMVVLIENEWTLIVPTTPTKEMIKASKEYEFELPNPLSGLYNPLSELQKLHDQITSIQRQLYTLEDVKASIETIQLQYQS